MLKSVTGYAGSAQKSETTYLYDDAKRLVTVKTGDKVQTRYQYDESGRKSAIESYDSAPVFANTVYVSHWEGTDLGFSPLPGGRVATTYNEQGVATGAQFYDADGNLATQTSPTGGQKASTKAK